MYNVYRGKNYLGRILGNRDFGMTKRNAEVKFGKGVRLVRDI